MSTGFQQPYVSPSPGSFDPSPPKKGMSTGCIVGIIAAVVIGGGGLVCCGGPMIFGIFAYNTGMGMISSAVENHPQVREHLGDVSSCTVDLKATGEVGQQNHLVFNVKGSKGSGVVTVHTQPAGEHVRILSGNIKLPAGETINLTPTN